LPSQSTQKSLQKYALFVGKNFRRGKQVIYNADRKPAAGRNTGYAYK
jgi:hypothetical protein